MDRRLLKRASLVSLMLGTATVACTPHGQVAGPASLSGTPVKGDKIAAEQAGKARDALAQHKSVQAVAAAERAAAASPRNAAYRMLLGQAYLAAGRFNSAETSFRDSLSLAPDQPRARFDLALAETAQGRGIDARAALQGLDGAVPKADLGLALTLAGDHEGGIAMLVAAARQNTSTARVRQNLALAYALDGKWREARAVAMQDTPPERISRQIADWASLAAPNQAERQVALMLGVQPSPDGGLPTALALATPPPADAPVALALAAATPSVAAKPEETAQTVPLADPVAAAPAAQVAEAPASTPPTPPVMLASATPRAPELLRASVKPTHMNFAPSASPPIARGGYVVQLGAYARMGAIDIAWAQAARISPQVATLSPVRGEFARSGATLVRLSIGGFSDRGDAVKLCTKVKARGGACFVRAAFNDAPLQWAKTGSGKVQLASD